METRLKLHLIHDAELHRNITFSRNLECFRRLHEDSQFITDAYLCISNFYIRSFKCDLYTDTLYVMWNELILKRYFENCYVVLRSKGYIL